MSYSPAKNLPMNAFMLYMSGNTVQIFSMMAVGMLFSTPIKGIAGVNQSEFDLSPPCWPISTHTSSLGTSLCTLRISISFADIAKDRIHSVPPSSGGLGVVEVLEYGASSNREQRLACMEATAHREWLRTSYKYI